MIIPRVSEIVQLYYPVTFVTQEALDRGTYYHHIVHDYLMRRDPSWMLEESVCHPLLEYLEHNLEEVLATEEQLVGGSHLPPFTGTPDAILRLKDRGLCLMDWKTSKKPTPANYVQLAGYRELDTHEYEGKHGPMRYALVFLGGPKLKIVDYQLDPHSTRIFLEGLHRWHENAKL